MAAPSGLIGRLGEFQQNRGTFGAYVERMEMFFTANNIVETESDGSDRVQITVRQRAIFLTEVGPEVYAVLTNLLAPAKPKDTPLSEILKKLSEHFDPKPLEIAESYRFGTRCQSPNEDISDFIVALKKLAIHCNYGEFQIRALRDRFVCGLKSDKIRSKLMTMQRLNLEMASQSLAKVAC